MERLPLPEVTAEQLERNENRAWRATDNDNCVCCGRPINNEDAFYVHMSTDWDMIHNDANVRDEDSQGCFPLGDGCAKKVHKDYKQKW